MLLLEFQFPSNGKGFPNFFVGCKEATMVVFQFPSNGKGFPNAGAWFNCPVILVSVSIPFKRERLSELLGRKGSGRTVMPTSFNSLQTGKAFRTFCTDYFCFSLKNVSIPFKRERLS